ncbi:hypothetical protein OIU77_005006 [Salix suchowensis]|uniref:Uncharacterized protein n=1 Tax=Salix suchowensis TaxID=1278906 RepID=A0ABQ9AXX0_9ROSI|nr:hypothetical protein OIU77_005006 [Salix suchowensis]
MKFPALCMVMWLLPLRNYCHLRFLYLIGPVSEVLEKCFF